MESEELVQLMQQIEEKGIGWDTIKEKTKISQELLNLYVKSGPIPVTIFKDLNKILEEADQWHNLVRSYLACTSFVDSQVGRVIEALERNGYAENTVIVLWSDHGWHLGEKLITGKNSLWDRSTRVPLVASSRRGGRMARLPMSQMVTPSVSSACTWMTQYS